MDLIAKRVRGEIETRLNDVFDSISDCEVNRAALELSRAGMEMIKGQEMGITQPHSEDHGRQVLNCYSLKTGALWASATKAIGIVCGTDG